MGAGLFWQFSNHSETGVVTSPGLEITPPIRGAGLRRGKAPGPTPDNPHPAAWLYQGATVPGGFRKTVVPAIFHPLKDIPRSIVQAETVGEKAPHWATFLTVP